MGNMEGRLRKEMGNMEGRLRKEMGNMEGRLMNRLDKTDKLIARALPSAAVGALDLVIAGDKEHLQKARTSGGSATWTLVEFEQNFCMVSALHCIKQSIATRCESGNCKQTLLEIPDDVAMYLKVCGCNVTHVLFAKHLADDDFQGHKDVSKDIVLLQLDKCPSSQGKFIPKADFIPYDELCNAVAGESTAGKCQSGTVQGTSLSVVIDDKTKKPHYYSTFIPSFGERGNSGTVMFLASDLHGGDKRALGIFKGMSKKEEGIKAWNNCPLSRRGDTSQGGEAYSRDNTIQRRSFDSSPRRL